MDNMEALFPGILSGVISGLFSYILVHACLRLFRPNVLISSKIAESTSFDSQNSIYRVKILDDSKRDIGDITIKISYRSITKGHYTFSVKDVPLLHSKKKEGNGITAKIKPTLITGNRKETVRDFFSDNPAGYIEIEVSYCDLSSWSSIWSGIRWTVVQRYNGSEAIVEKSFFPENSTEPEFLQDYKNRYNNC